KASDNRSGNVNVKYFFRFIFRDCSVFDLASKPYLKAPAGKALGRKLTVGPKGADGNTELPGAESKDRFTSGAAGRNSRRCREARASIHCLQNAIPKGAQGQSQQ